MRSTKPILSLSLSVLSYLAFPLLHAQAPPTPEQLLKGRGIALTTDSLRGALRDPRQDVRGLAAAVLADRDDKASIPFIEEALTYSINPLEKQNLAQALISLGDRQGFVAMQELCADSNLREDSRLIIAQQLADTGDNSCLPSVATILSTTSDHSVRLSAIKFVSRFPELPPTLRPTVELGLVKALRDEVPQIRQEASKSVASFKMYSAVPALRTAKDAEQEPATQREMSADLAKLKQPTQ